MVFDDMMVSTMSLKFRNMSSHMSVNTGTAFEYVHGLDHGVNFTGLGCHKSA